MSKTGDGNVERGSKTWSEVSREIWRTQEAGRSSDPEPAPLLDVERLADAIQSWGKRAGVGFGAMPAYWRRAAEHITAEYGADPALQAAGEPEA